MEEGTNLFVESKILKSLTKISEQKTKFMVNLTEIAKSHSTHVLTLSQLNRDSSREGRKPRLIDLKGSGGIEEKASLAHYYLSREPDSDEGNLSILKARSGPAGWNIPLNFNHKRLTFVEGCK